MPRLRYAFCPLCIVMLITFGASPLAAEEQGETYQLRYRFRVGDVVEYTVENHSQIELQQGEAVQEVDHQQSTRKHYHVISIDDEGNATLELTIDRVQMSAAVDGGEPVEFDSARDENAPAQFVGVAETVGRPHARIKVSPTGELLHIEWLVKGEQDELPTRDDAGNLDILVQFPKEAVAVDQKWKQRFETEVVLNGLLRKNVTLQRTYRLTAVENDRAVIELQTSILTPLHDPAQEAQLIQKAPSGTIEFDLERGVLLSRSTSVDRSIVGFSGAKSRIRNVTTRTERIAEIAGEGNGSPAVKSAQATSEQPQ